MATDRCSCAGHAYADFVMRALCPARATPQCSVAASFVCGLMKQRSRIRAPREGVRQAAVMSVS